MDLRHCTILPGMAPTYVRLCPASHPRLAPMLLLIIAGFEANVVLRMYFSLRSMCCTMSDVGPNLMLHGQGGHRPALMPDGPQKK